MTAIGINISMRDEVNGWESINPEPMPRLKAVYETAKANADDAWDWYYLLVDQWEYARMKYGDSSDVAKFNKGLMDDQRALAERADGKKETAYKQMNCPHVNREMFDQVEVCLDCGAKF